MIAALALGRRGLGRVWPNPAVGCLVVKDGIVVGRGFTADGGRPHAETQALAQADLFAADATVYVTLEPCAHHGKTPPCTSALITAGVSRVVVATSDPDPRVSGRGIALLRNAGIVVEENVCKEQADIDHAGFFNRVRLGRPFITLKLASTLDGRIATQSGDSQWITGPDARRMVHVMRANHDAVMVGAGTARADDPQLNVRGVGAASQPDRVVVSKGLDLPLKSNLIRTSKDQPVWLLHGPDADVSQWSDRGAKLVECELSHGEVDLADAMGKLSEAGMTRVFCEGGGQLAASLVSQGLVDELVVFSAGAVIGADGRPSLSQLGVSKLVSAPRFKLRETRQIGADILHCWIPL